MDIIIETRIKATFKGWSKGTIFALADGNPKKWQQVEEKDQLRYLYRPKATLIRDGSQHYLKVEGMDDMVEVKRA
jgi:hypothetical protein